MNTRIDYLYRDAANYKKGGHVVITGECSVAQIEALRKACMVEDDNAFFVPAAVDMPMLNTDEPWDDEIDHPYHALGEASMTSDQASDTRTIGDLIDSFSGIDWQDAAATWDEARAA